MRELPLSPKKKIFFFFFLLFHSLIVAHSSGSLTYRNIQKKKTLAPWMYAFKEIPSRWFQHHHPSKSYSSSSCFTFRFLSLTSYSAMLLLMLLLVFWGISWALKMSILKLESLSNEKKKEMSTVGIWKEETTLDIKRQIAFENSSKKLWRWCFNINMPSHIQKLTI